MVKLGIVIWYQANKAYIAQNLCENRDKPEMKCCGKCYLKKQLRKADSNTEKQNRNTPVKTVQIELAACVLPRINTLTYGRHLYDPAIQNPAGERRFGIRLPQSIFHPPSPVRFFV